MLRLNKTGFSLLFFFTLFFFDLSAQCPSLNQTSTLSSPDCAPGSNPCAVCPGDQVTVTASGNNLTPGSCVNWYYGTTPNFNPYDGEGTLLGCAEIEIEAPDPCADCPILLGILVDACGTEENNEFLAVWSGSGFFVDDFQVDLDAANNVMGAENGDPGIDCPWQMPDAFAISSVQNNCPNATVIGVGPGGAVPPGVPVVVFTSGGLDNDYNFSGLCSVVSTIYVMQNSCVRTIGAFSNAGSGTRTTSISLGCGCSDATTYDRANLIGGNGAYVTDVLGFPFYGNAGCSWPSFPGLVDNDPISVPPFTFDITQDMCNGGPYYVVGVVDPLPAGCNETFTNYLAYDVPCPAPVALPGSMCENNGVFALNSLLDPVVPGTWSGPGVSGSTFNPVGLVGINDLTFTPSAPCGVPAVTTMQVWAPPTAVFDPVGQVCPGQNLDLSITFTGEGPWSFNLRANGTIIGTFTDIFDNPFVTTVNPSGNTTYTVTNLMDAHCNGSNATLSVTVSSPPSGNLTLSGNNTVCSGSPVNLVVTFNGGGPPYTFEYAIDGTTQTAVTTDDNPYTFQEFPTQTSTYSLVTVDANGCTGTATGSVLVTVNPEPTANMNSGLSVICEGETVNLEVELDGVNGSYSFIYSINGVNQAPVVASGPDVVTIPVSPGPGTTDYAMVSVTAEGCPGTVSGSYQIIVTDPPTATIGGNFTLCSGASDTIFVDFGNSPGPYTFTYTAGGVAQPAVTTTLDPYPLIVSPTTTTQYILTGVSTNGCVGTATGQVTVTIAPSLSATISGGGQICQNGSGTYIIFSFLGQGPYTYTYTAGNVLQPPVTTTDNPDSIFVNPSNGTIYQLVSVSNGVCSGSVSGLAGVFVFTAPTAVMSGTATFCDSAVTNVMVDFTGTGPFTIGYNIDGVPQPQVTTFDDPYLIPVNSTTSTTYTLTLVESPGCNGTATGQAVLTVNYKPVATNLNLTCNQVAGTYVVSFDVLNATLPLTLVSGSGTFNGTTFTSNPIPESSGYSFAFHDANNCGDVIVSGQSNCNCVTDAGTMNINAQNLCVSDTAFALHNGNQNLDPNDSLKFVIQSNPGAPIGQIFGWSNTPQFVFGNGMQAGVTYYISAVAGNALNGQVDLMDPCLSVSAGVPVTFFGPPSAVFDSIGPICANTAIDVPLTLTGNGPFTVQYAIDGVAQAPVANIPGPVYLINIQPDSTTTLTLVSVEDTYCTSLASDTVVITVNDAPEIANLAQDCNILPGNYVVSFEITNPALPLVINGLTGVLNGNQFVSDPIPNTDAYSVTISDANNCGQTVLSGVSSCSCSTDAGVMSPGTLIVCQNQNVSAPFSSGFVLETNDMLMYALHDLAGDSLGTILATNTNPTFSFLPGMQTDVVYYISAVAGNESNGQVDLNDICLSVAAGTPVIFHGSPLADLGILDTSICLGATIDLAVQLTGSAPFTLQASVQGAPQAPVTNIAGNTYTITLSPTQNTVVQLISVSDQYCSTGSVSGNVNIGVNGTPQIGNLQTICNDNTGEYTVSFEIQNGLAPYFITGLNGVLTGNVFVSDPLPSGAGYSIAVQDTFQCGQASVSGTFGCTCSTDAGIMSQVPLTLCAGDTAFLSAPAGLVEAPGDTVLYVLGTNPDPLTGTILATNDEPVFSFINGQMVAGTPYYVSVLVGNATPTGVDVNDFCFDVAQGPALTWRPQITATLAGFEDICAGDTTFFTIQFSGGAPYNFTYEVNGNPQFPITATGNTFQLQVIPLNTITYTLVSVSGNGCSGTASGSATAHVSKLSITNVDTVCNYTTQEYTLQFHISNGADPNDVYTISGVTGTLSDSVFTSNPVAWGTPYNVTVSNPTGCTATLSGTPNCACLTDAGSISSGPLSLCTSEIATVVANNDEVLDGDDVLQYILYQNPNALPAGIIQTSSQPQFGFQPGMVAGQTYYIAAIAGSAGAGGNINLNDPCLSISTGIPVVFTTPPTASLTGDQTVCAGGNASFTVQFTGTAPYQFVYAVNGNNQLPQNALLNTFSISATNLQQTQTFTLISVQDANCPGTVTGQAVVNVLPLPAGDLLQDVTICKGDTVELSLALSGGSTYNVTISGGASPLVLNNVQDGAVASVSPGSTTTYFISSLVATGNTCPVSIGEDATVTVNEVLAASQLSDYNGFGTSCAESTDGSISVTPNGGLAPYSAVWSSGDNGLVNNGLTAGTYTVTISDANGCSFTETYSLTSPPALSLSASSEDPDCFGDNNGVITLENVSGGVDPYVVLLDNQTLFTADVFPVDIESLQAGVYNLSIEDANGCETATEVILNEPVELSVNLGPDTTISLGDSILLQPIISNPAIDTFAWTPVQFLSTPLSVASYAQPDASITYTLWVRDEAGCTAEDAILIAVKKEKRIFIPNALSLNAGQGNSTLTVFAGPEVRNVKFMRVYDRWGECMFEGLDLAPNDPGKGWNGRFRNKEVNPGVYVYVVEVEFADGTTEIISGDVSILK